MKHTKRTTQQVSRAALSGHPRLCPICQQMVGTKSKRFNRHGTSAGECAGSGQMVEPKAESRPICPKCKRSVVIVIDVFGEHQSRLGIRCAMSGEPATRPA
jgi:hypothetical protein